MVFHARTDPGFEAIRIRGGLRTEPMPSLVAVVAGCHHVRAMSAAVLLRQQVLARCLQARGLA